MELTDIMVDSKQSREYISGKYRPRVDKSLITSLPKNVDSCACGRLDLDSLIKEKGKSVFNIHEKASMSGG